MGSRDKAKGTHRLVILGAALAVCGAAVWSMSTYPAMAQSSEGDDVELRNSHIYPMCVDSPEECGEIRYENKGAYAVTASLTTIGKQPSINTLHEKCGDVDVYFLAAFGSGIKTKFVVPASCAYKLKIEISAGRTKDRNLFPTPGCLIKLSTDGTTLSNKWSKVRSSGTETDAGGYECGSLGDAGT
jgi:hypothetical protein